MTVTTVSKTNPPLYPDKLTSAGKEDEAMHALQQIFGTLIASESGLMKEAQKTEETAQRVFEELQERFTTLAMENLKLREQLVATESRQRELDIAYGTEKNALQQKADFATNSAETTHKELVAIRQEMSIHVHSLLAEKEKAIQATIEAANVQIAMHQQSVNVQIAAIKQQANVDKEKAVQAATLAADARIAAHLRSTNTQLSAIQHSIEHAADTYAFGASYPKIRIGGLELHLSSVQTAMQHRKGTLIRWNSRSCYNSKAFCHLSPQEQQSGLDYTQELVVKVAEQFQFSHQQGQLLKAAVDRTCQQLKDLAAKNTL